ncbi:MAG: peptidoglycan DD-metalloendopeptidase family protein [Saprospiraceae bacterium]|uniref:Peptidoglycan DD-metalloendopeptidase family protein n=1 Tax=Candidatus Defluviibacterium haderslevense TaxID=2981993 RepID=A0A9D7XHS0_9BACT|nr:peptidoglycan DD-metalloendopeptidase family protein [Candidatus Defluviibacterium haderslevense]
MKKVMLLICCLLVFLFISISFGQVNSGFQISNEDYGNFSSNNAEHPCISEEQYLMIEQSCKENIQLLQSKGVLHKNSAAVTLFNWPLKAANGLSDCSFYRISAYVDQNTGSGTIQDFSCGTNTYDGHRGTDISIWPFNFYKMDHDFVEVIAAAPGIIINKHDGEFDKNCAANNQTANYLIIRHADGSQANYWHMKKNSLTKKVIGESVLAGEYLGIVGSSGSSTGPHLHFEVWAGSTVATRVDPYAGNCNTLNAISWWANQKSYMETGIVKVSVNTTDIVFPACPATETPNESDVFQIPFQGAGLAPGFAKFYIFIREEMSGLTANMSILNPDGTTFTSWTYMSTAANKTRINGFSKKLPTTPGIYTFMANYNGTICSKTFKITAATNTDNLNHENKSIIYPNPSSGTFILEMKKSVATEIEIFNLLGVIVYRASIIKPITEFNLNLPANIYLYKIRNENKVSDTGKLLIE